MQQLIDRRRWPFVVVIAIVAITAIAVMRLPDLFLAHIRQDRPLSSAQAGWVFRLLAAIACAQALYGGFFALDPDRIKKAREKDKRLRDMRADAIATSAARNAAGMIFLTLVYGIADLALTGERGSFWLFPLVILGQAAWYYRQVGQIGRWLVFQPEPERGPDRYAVPEIPPDWAPAIARGLIEAEHSSRS
ncbi:MAG: hypothetical protein M3290_10415 [Actinomycetota bacterium]|nr:hypothetical protein [Actinomycetota bacterium]